MFARDHQTERIGGQAETRRQRPFGPRHSLFLAAVVWAIWGAAAALGGSGCSQSLEEAGASAPADCWTLGCPSGEACGPNGECLPPADDAVLAIRVTPPLDSDLMEQHFTDIQVGDLADGQFGELALSQPTTVTGTAYFSGGLDEVPAGRITFRQLAGIPNAQISAEATLDPQGGFELEVVPGRYQVTVDLEMPGVDLPPFRAEDRDVSGNLTISVALPHPEAYTLVQGQVVRTRPPDQEEVPISGARVVLTGEEGDVFSSTGETDVDGRFSLLVAPGERDYQVRLSPGSSDVVPRLVLDSVTITEDSDLGTLVAGEWLDPVEVSGHVDGVNGAAVPVEAATVHFRRELELGSFTQVALADAAGEFAETVIPGSYSITLIPPADSPYAAAIFESAVNAERNEQPFSLVQKPMMTGTIYDTSGLPVSGVRVSAEPTSYTVRALSLLPVETETDAAGRFQLSVHPGHQRLVVLPSEGDGLAPLVAELADVQGFEVNLQLKPAHEVTLGIAGPDGSPVAGAAYEIFLLQGDDLVPLADGESDRDGRFVLSLPSVGF
jgi:hypothetical protein